MSYEIRFEQKDTYLHATVTGTNSRDNVLAYMADISRECDRRQCFRVLIEERLDGPRLATLDIFAIASEGSMRALGGGIRVESELGAGSKITLVFPAA